jgi:lactate 2-monooxygenase
MKIDRPKSDNVALSLLSRAKANGFSALVVTVDLMELGWRPHDLETSYSPFSYGVGIQVGSSDPVFMTKLGLEPVKNPEPAFPFDIESMRRKEMSGDQEMLKEMQLARTWLGETDSGKYRTWKDLKLLRDHWDGPLIIKGIQTAEV